MDTKNFVDIIKKFGNENKPANDMQNHVPSFLNDLYPYGQFPSQYTKNGQNEKNTTASTQLNCDNPELKQHTSTLDNRASHQHSNQSSHQDQGMFGGMDLKSLLPLMMNMKNNDKFNTFDIFNLLMPTLGGGNNDNMKDLMKFFSQSKPKTMQEEKKIKPSKMPSIDSYIKI